METLKLGECGEEVIRAIQEGKVFIYPTDSIYGIGCNALVGESVKKIRKLKKSDHPFSVIAPSKQWIVQNLIMKHDEYLRKLPGRYTLIFEKKKPGFLKECSPLSNLGVRIPDHAFTRIIEEAGVPFVTTSVNVSGKKHISRLEEIPEAILHSVDFAVYGGVLSNKASRIIDLTGKKPKQVR